MSDYFIANNQYSLLFYFLVRSSSVDNTHFIIGEKLYNSLDLDDFNVTLLKDPPERLVHKIYFYLKYYMVQQVYIRNRLKLNSNSKFYGHDHLYFSNLIVDNLTLIEDGVKTYKEKSDSRNLLVKFFSSGKLDKINGRSKLVNKVLLSGVLPIPDDIKDKCEIHCLKSAFNELNNTHKSRLLTVFNFKNINVSSLSGRDVLFTQPLDKAGYCTSSEMLNIYKKIISMMGLNNLVIKPHPLDEVDYSELSCDILPRNFPSEFFCFFDIRFNKAVSLFSTAVLSVKANENKQFGCCWDDVAFLNEE